MADTVIHDCGGIDDKVFVAKTLVIQVYKNQLHNTYEIHRNGKINHSNRSAEDTIKILSQYLTTIEQLYLHRPEDNFKHSKET